MEKAERKREKFSMKTGLVALSLAMPYGHEKAYAAEIPSTASWEEGAAELERSVKQDQAEHKAMFLIGTDGHTAWTTVKGGVQSVSSYPSRLFKDLTSDDASSLTAVCDIHTHPAASIEAEFQLPAEESATLVPLHAYAPPSFGDTDVGPLRRKQVLETANAMHIPIGGVYQAVFDPRGVWYYRDFTDTEKTDAGLPASVNYEVTMPQFDQKQREFVIRSGSLASFEFAAEYAELVTAYRELLGVRVRFVSHEDRKKEPPCAGPDYDNR
jgi:hypothetical protein